MITQGLLDRVGEWKLKVIYQKKSIRNQILERKSERKMDFAVGFFVQNQILNVLDYGKRRTF